MIISLHKFTEVYSQTERIKTETCEREKNKKMFTFSNLATKV